MELDIPPKKEVLVYAPLAEAQEWYYTALLNKTIMDLVGKRRMPTSECSSTMTVYSNEDKENMNQQDAQMHAGKENQTSVENFHECIRKSTRVKKTLSW